MYILNRGLCVSMNYSCILLTEECITKPLHIGETFRVFLFPFGYNLHVQKEHYDNIILPKWQ